MVISNYTYVYVLNEAPRLTTLSYDRMAAIEIGTTFPDHHITTCRHRKEEFHCRSNMARTCTAARRHFFKVTTTEKKAKLDSSSN